MRYLNRWSMSCIWVAAMVVAWFGLVPSLLSPGFWVLATIAGPVLLLGGGVFWENKRPTPSFRQSQVTADSRDVNAARKL